jgi:hypothetical protein
MHDAFPHGIRRQRSASNIIHPKRINSDFARMNASMNARAYIACEGSWMLTDMLCQ